jgi:hypothetical protein
MMRRFLVAVLLLPLIAAGCGKGPAEAALKASDEAIAKVRPEAEKFVPEQFKALTDAAASAKGSFDKGDYAAALATAKDLPAKANDVLTAAAARREEVLALWKGVEATVAPQMAQIVATVANLESLKRLPAGLDAERFAAVKAARTDVVADWTKATELFTTGDVTKAVALAGQVKPKAEAVLALLAPLLPASTAAQAAAAPAAAPVKK